MSQNRHRPGYGQYVSNHTTDETNSRSAFFNVQEVRGSLFKGRGVASFLGRGVTYSPLDYYMPVDRTKDQLYIDGVTNGASFGKLTVVHPYFNETQSKILDSYVKISADNWIEFVGSRSMASYYPSIDTANAFGANHSSPNSLPWVRWCSYCFGFPEEFYLKLGVPLAFDKMRFSSPDTNRLCVSLCSVTENSLSLSFYNNFIINSDQDISIPSGYERLMILQDYWVSNGSVQSPDVSPFWNITSLKFHVNSSIDLTEFSSFDGDVILPGLHQHGDQLSRLSTVSGVTLNQKMVSPIFEFTDLSGVPLNSELHGFISKYNCSHHVDNYESEVYGGEAHPGEYNVWRAVCGPLDNWWNGVVRPPHGHVRIPLILDFFGRSFTVDLTIDSYFFGSQYWGVTFRHTNCSVSIFAAEDETILEFDSGADSSITVFNEFDGLDDVLKENGAISPLVTISGGGRAGNPRGFFTLSDQQTVRVEIAKVRPDVADRVRISKVKEIPYDSGDVLNNGSGATPERALVIDLSEGVGSVNGDLRNTCYMYDDRFYQTAYLLQGVSGSGSAGKIDSIPNISKTSNTLSIGGFNFSLISDSFDGQMDLVLLDGLYYLVVWNYWPLDDGYMDPESNNFTILVA